MKQDKTALILIMMILMSSLASASLWDSFLSSGSSFFSKIFSNSKTATASAKTTDAKTTNSTNSTSLKKTANKSKTTNLPGSNLPDFYIKSMELKGTSQVPLVFYTICNAGKSYNGKLKNKIDFNGKKEEITLMNMILPANSCETNPFDLTFTLSKSEKEGIDKKENDVIITINSDDSVNEDNKKSNTAKAKLKYNSGPISGEDVIKKEHNSTIMQNNVSTNIIHVQQNNTTITAIAINSSIPSKLINKIPSFKIPRVI